MRLRSAKGALAFTFLILGVALAVQLRVERHSREVSPDLSGLSGMAEMLNRSEAEVSRLTAEVSRLKAEVSARAARANLDRELRRELAEARMEAGLTAVSGPGVTVVLQNPAGLSAGVAVIHDIDVLEILNELRAAGAEALAINGQRVLATTEVSQAGNIFSINNRPAAPPFTILALGPPHTMAAALNLRGGVAETLEAIGIQVTIREGRVTIPAYSGP